MKLSATYILAAVAAVAMVAACILFVQPAKEGGELSPTPEANAAIAAMMKIGSPKQGFNPAAANVAADPAAHSSVANSILAAQVKALTSEVHTLREQLTRAADGYRQLELFVQNLSTSLEQSPDRKITMEEYNAKEAELTQLLQSKVAQVERMRALGFEEADRLGVPRALIDRPDLPLPPQVQGPALLDLHEARMRLQLARNIYEQAETERSTIRMSVRMTPPQGRR